MMDQLASIGVEFDEATILRIFTRLERYYRDKDAEENASQNDSKNGRRRRPVDLDSSGAAPDDLSSSGLCGSIAAFFKPKPRWAVDPIYTRNVPVRPWGLGAILKPVGLLTRIFGKKMRTPGLYRKPNPMTGKTTASFLEDTNERIHSSVRIRLALHGLGLNDKGIWDIPALKGKWRLVRTLDEFQDPIPSSLQTWEPQELVKKAEQETGGASGMETHLHPSRNELISLSVQQQRPLTPVLRRQDGRWVWEYCGPESEAPNQRVLVEEPLGPYERQLLRLAGGDPNVYEFAEGLDIRFGN
jgi:hypothetical protein